MRRGTVFAAFALIAALSLPSTVYGAVPTCLGHPATIVGTNGDDRLSGGHGKDVIAGLGGNDTLHGLGGPDLACGGEGNDLIVDGGAFGGNDVISGGPGNDRLRGGNQAFGGPGNDTFIEGCVDYGRVPGPVTVDLRTGRATVEGTDVFRSVHCVFGTPFDDVIIGVYNDVWGLHLAGRGGDDELTGVTNPDLLEGGSGDDVLRSGGGGDQLDGGAGNDILDGGAGTDVVIYDGAPAAVQLDLAAGTARHA